jgi:hypothetical protein
MSVMATIDIPMPFTETEDKAPLVADHASSSLITNPAETSDQYSQSINFTVDESHSQLSAPRTNTPEQQFVPPEIISSSISKTRLQCELLRPLLAGTYQEVPAYLLKLQFQFQVTKGDRSWLKRIQTASISVVLEDAPLVKKIQTGRRRRAAQSDDDIKHPAVVETFPGPEGWQGPVSTRLISTEVGVGLQAGWAGLGADVNWSQSRTKDDTGLTKVKTMRTGPQRNNLLVTVEENPIDASGIPELLVIPLLVTHHSRRFSMRVTVKATFGFWRGKVAESIPVLGRADDPAFFDPAILAQKLEAGEKGIGGVKLIDWAGELDDVCLQAHSSLQRSSD